MNVFITGATGFVGRPLVAALRARGDDVTVMTRSAARARELGATRVVEGELETPGPWQDALAGHDAIVHLAGESVAGRRWDARQKQVIRDSRVEATRALVDALAAVPVDRRPRTLIGASGVDYYPYAGGSMDDDEVTEADPPGDEFLARVCRDWEKETAVAETYGVRVVRLRIGAVLGKGGGALEKIVPTFKAFVGGKLGDGRQWFSWIHLDDVVGIVVAALDDAAYTGAVNVVTESVRYAEFAKALGHVLHRPSFWRVPGFALKLVAGELGSVLLHGRRVVPTALAARAYRFKHATLADALAYSI